MRWNCPHCGIALAISDEKLGNNWSFSRCYKCGGFAMVRRTDSHLVKVDQAPAGEPLVLPESSDPPALSSKAIQHLASIKPVIKAAQRRKQNTEATLTARNPEAKGNEAQAAQNPQNTPVAPATPDKPRTIPQRFIPKAEVHGISVPRTHAPALEESPAIKGPVPPPPPRAAEISPVFLGKSLPEPLPEVPQRSAYQRFLPVAIILAGLVAVTSGFYLYHQGQNLMKKVQPRRLAIKPATTLSQALPAATQQNPVTIPPLAPNPLTDQLNQKAMAPERSPCPKSSTGACLLVQSRVDKASLRTGPGLEFPVLGIANPEKKYAVIDWNDRWFKVNISDDPAAEKAAWIRNDLVKLCDSP